MKLSLNGNNKLSEKIRYRQSINVEYQAVKLRYQRDKNKNKICDNDNERAGNNGHNHISLKMKRLNHIQSDFFKLEYCKVLGENSNKINWGKNGQFFLMVGVFVVVTLQLF